MKKKLYSYSIMAQQREWGCINTTLITRNRAGAIVALGEHEALGMALGKARETFPESERYFNHGVSVLEIPSELIDLVRNCEEKE